jgi:hypothetical protein
MEYDYASFSLPRLLADVSFDSGPYPGEVFPDFDLPTATGGRITRDQLLERGPALITMGSYTCPMTASAGPTLRRLHAEFGYPITFMTLYVREAHPGREYPQATLLDQKIRFARDYKKRDGIPWTVAVDDVAGTLHRQLDAKPNSAYIVGPDAVVLYRTLWSGHEWTLRQGLAVVAAGGRPMEQREPRLMPMAAGLGEMYRMLELAGDGAKRDVLYRAPPMYVLARLAHLLPFAGPMRRGVGAMGVLFGLGVGGAVAAARSRRRSGTEKEIPEKRRRRTD